MQFVAAQLDQERWTQLVRSVAWSFLTMRPRVRMLAMGGTIAGKASNRVEAREYDFGVMPGSEIVDRVPEVSSYADVDVVDVSTRGSHANTPAHYPIAIAGSGGVSFRGDGLDIYAGVRTARQARIELMLDIAARTS